MNKALLLTLLLACAGVAQTDSNFLQYSEGDYAELPFPYTTELSLEQARAIVSRVAELFDGEIEGIYHTSPGLRLGGDQIQVHVCAKGIRAVRRCDQGWFYVFVRAGTQWELKSEQPGTWVY